MAAGRHTCGLAGGTLNRTAAGAAATLRRYPVALGMVTAAALGVRLVWLGQHLLWRDEVFTSVVVQRPLRAMFDALRQDSAPPLAYLLIHALNAAWSGPVALRLVSVLAGTATVPLAAALARRCAGEGAAICTAAFVALAPAFVASARDARAYALATALVTAALLTMWRAAERPTAPRLVVHAMVVAAAVNTHYFATLAVAADGLALLFIMRPPLRVALRVGVATVIGGLALLPWLIYAAGAQSGHLGAPFWASGVDPYHVGGMLAEFLNGPSVSHSIDNGILILVLEGLAVAGGAVGLLGAVAWWHGAAAERRRALLLVVGGVVLGWLALVLVSLRYAVIEGRYASVFWGPMAVAVGTGLARLGRPLRAVAAACIGAGAVALTLFTVHPQAAALLAVMPAQTGPHDVVAVDPGDYLLLLEYASPQTLARSRVISGDLPWYWGVAAFPPGAVTPALPPDVAAGHGTVYVVWDTTEQVPPLPGGYQRSALRCDSAICVATYSG